MSLNLDEHPLRWRTLLQSVVLRAGALVPGGDRHRTDLGRVPGADRAHRRALAGLFLLGVFTERASGRGAAVGAAVAVVAVFAVQRYTAVHFFLYAAVGIVTCFVVGYVASCVLPAEPRRLTGLTIFTREKGPTRDVAAPTGVEIG